MGDLTALFSPPEPLGSTPKAPGTVRIGSGAGYAGDRIEPAAELAEYGDLDYLVFELLGERTIAAAHLRRLQEDRSGYDPLLLDRIRAVAPHCATTGTRIITNGGAANPTEAAQDVRKLLDSLGLNLRVAAVTGDDVLPLVREVDPPTWESAREVSREKGDLVSANAYIGAEGIRSALEAGADVVIAGRAADPSLFVAPLAHEFGWDLHDAPTIGAATAVGHLLECAGQVTGGYFADPLTKPVPNLDRLGFPFADVAADGTAVISKLTGSGGMVSARTCTEQLLYEVGNPRAYVTPDVTADFSTVTFDEVGEDRVRVENASGEPAPDTLKVTLGYLAGWEGEGQISYAGPRSLERAELGAEIVTRRLIRLRGVDRDDVRTELIGAGASFRGLEAPGNPEEVRLRIAVMTPSRDVATSVGREVETLYTNGPAGGGGARSTIREVLAIKSVSVDRSLVRVGIEMFEPPLATREME